jgi:AAA domain-containing protein
MKPRDLTPDERAEAFRKGEGVIDDLAADNEAERGFGILPMLGSEDYDAVVHGSANGHAPGRPPAASVGGPAGELAPDARSGGDGHGEATEDPLEARVLARLFGLRVEQEAKRRFLAEHRPPAQAPELLSLRDRLARPPDPVRYRVDEWQPAGGRALLAAQYKAGKTTLVENLVRSLVDGDPFLDRYEVQPVDGTVAVVDFEMSPRQLDLWYRDQKIRNDDRVLLVPMRGAAAGFDLLDPETLAGWAARLRDREVAYLVVDCLRPLMDTLGLDEHREAGRLLVALDQLLLDGGVGEALVVHHMGHTAERSRGDSRLRDWPDVEWRLVRQDPDDPASPRFVTAFGRDVEVPESRLEYDPTGRRLAVAGGSRKDAEQEAALVAVLRLLEEKPRQSANKIELALSGKDAREKHPRKAVRQALEVGVRDGSVVAEPGRYGGNEYSISPARRSSPEVRRRTGGRFAGSLKEGEPPEGEPEGGGSPQRTSGEPGAQGTLWVGDDEQPQPAPLCPVPGCGQPLSEANLRNGDTTHTAHCRDCRQPLLAPASIAAGQCERCRLATPPTEGDQQ